MRQMILGLGFVLLTVWLCGQSPAEKKDKATIQRAKSLLVSSVDKSLPKVTLEYFLQYESGGEAIQWEVNDCGEESGNPAVDSGREFPICVEANFGGNNVAVSVVISVGTFKKGQSGAPAFFSAMVTDFAGKSHPLRHLGELPMALHRPAPRGPRDLLDPAGAL
jgi:hypothetical protein